MRWCYLFSSCQGMLYCSLLQLRWWTFIYLSGNGELKSWKMASEWTSWYFTSKSFSRVYFTLPLQIHNGLNTWKKKKPIIPHNLAVGGYESKLLRVHPEAIFQDFSSPFPDQKIKIHLQSWRSLQYNIPWQFEKR